MLARAITAGVPCGWFAADYGYGRDPGLRAFCHDHTIAYVLAVRWTCHWSMCGAKPCAARTS